MWNYLGMFWNIGKRFLRVHIEDFYSAVEMLECLQWKRKQLQLLKLRILFVLQLRNL